MGKLCDGAGLVRRDGKNLGQFGNVKGSIRPRFYARTRIISEVKSLAKFRIRFIELKIEDKPFKCKEKIIKFIAILF